MNRESKTRNRADKELTTKPKRKYIKRPIPKTRNNRFGMCNRNRKSNSDSGKVEDNSIVALLNSLLEKINRPGNTNRSQILISSF